MKTIAVAVLLTCFSFAKAQDWGGFTFGINSAFVPEGIYDQWLEQYQTDNRFSTGLEAPKVLTGPHVGLMYHGDWLDVGFGYSWRSSAQRVNRLDGFNREVEYKYKFKYGVFHFPEMVFYPGGSELGFGISFDAGQFKVTTRNMENRFGGGGVVSDWTLGHQFILRLRIPGDVIGTITAYYQYSYLNAGWATTPDNPNGVRPNMFGFRALMTVDAFGDKR